jgi:hypothetical protein
VDEKEIFIDRDGRAVHVLFNYFRNSATFSRVRTAVPGASRRAAYLAARAVPARDREGQAVATWRDVT